MQTRLQVVDALASSSEATEKFWKVWQEQYLTSLREKQRTLLTNRRQGRLVPKVGDVVLVSDPVLPRNSWKMARVTAANQGSDGSIREIELKTPTQRKIRRPVNLVVPLEISSDDDRPIQGEPNSRTDSNSATEGTHDAVRPQTTSKYNLRPRPPKNYAERTITTMSTRAQKGLPGKWFLFHIMILSLVASVFGQPTPQIQLTCAANGVSVHTSTNQSFELCTDAVCRTYDQPSNPLLVKLPPETTLHDYAVTLKWHENDKLAVMETTCPKLDFCEQVDCTICSTTLLNPECWPVGAILTMALLLYAVVAFLYVLLYVPMTIGKPIRLLLRALMALLIVSFKIIRQCWMCFTCPTNRRRRTASERIAAALAIWALIMTQKHYTTDACQHVDLIQNPTTTCIRSENSESCSTTLSGLLKLNSFQREACLRLTNNSTLIAHIKLRWKGMYLRCERETYFFTRAVDLRTIDSKRCPDMGSCVNGKCEDINSSSLIPELEMGNNFPGRTGCL
ncbi:unnamed protein product, partial [Nippostrongylus brasiliensis]|uniref:Phlebovirus_G2 domain-containing protein n=1 Tax=Nippostrongylus brasiliensis TaxID=27835 RepID=A0A0N4YZ90_NIPBR